MPDEQLLNFWCILQHAENGAHACKKLDNRSLSGLMWQRCIQERNAEVWILLCFEDFLFQIFTIWVYRFFPCGGMVTYLHSFETGGPVLKQLHTWNSPIKQNAIGFFPCFRLSRRNVPSRGDALAGKRLYTQERNFGVTQGQMLIYYSWINPQ